jgi:hypothetical protein
LKYLDNIGLGNYIYLENTFDYGNLGFIIKDVELCGFHLGVILRNSRWNSIRDILLPIYDNETKRESVRRKLIQLVGYGKNVNVLYPLKEKTKSDVMDAMPKHLLDLCWYCRTPKQYEPCGTCKTCKQVNDVFYVQKT